MKELIEERIQTVLLFMENCMDGMDRCERKGELLNYSCYSGELSVSAKELAFLNELLSEINK
jgi:hypothetical protein